MTRQLVVGGLARRRATVWVAVVGLVAALVTGLVVACPPSGRPPEVQPATSRMATSTTVRDSTGGLGLPRAATIT